MIRRHRSRHSVPRYRYCIPYLQLLLPLFVQRDVDGGLPLLLGFRGGLPLGDAAAFQGGANCLGLSFVRRLFYHRRHKNIQTPVVLKVRLLGWVGKYAAKD